ncbi:hypothetical protein PR048_002480 [Dryococelus australis]|uniref:Uncharacterized protein n=1 Tax=Dryococelus australis TaxID=614101 RepID=A0ABQ9IKE5_9NEOP|nr:hypothetical protein PR048_002480 [Dryococelus australis]
MGLVCSVCSKSCTAPRLGLLKRLEFAVQWSTLLHGVMGEWLDYSLTPKADRVQFSVGSPLDFRIWESCRTMPLLDVFSRGSPVYPGLAILTSPLSALNISILKATQISSITYLFTCQTGKKLANSWHATCTIAGPEVAPLTLPITGPGFNYRRAHPRIFSWGNHFGRCGWSAGFLGDLHSYLKVGKIIIPGYVLHEQRLSKLKSSFRLWRCKSDGQIPDRWELITWAPEGWQVYETRLYIRPYHYESERGLCYVPTADECGDRGSRRGCAPTTSSDSPGGRGLTEGAAQPAPSVVGQADGGATVAYPSRALPCYTNLVANPYRALVQRWRTCRLSSAVSCVTGKFIVMPSSVSEEQSNEVKESASMPRRRQRAQYHYVSKVEWGIMIGLRETARTVHAATTAMRVWHQWIEDGRMQRREGNGLLNVTTARDDRHLVRMAAKDRTVLDQHWSTSTGVDLSA